MASIEERVGNLVETHLGITDRSMLDSPGSELGVNSMDAVAFLKTVTQEFGVEISPEEASGFTKLRDLVNFLEANAG